MAEKITPLQLLYLQDSVTIFDVRSPSEFLQGHIFGARNLPLLSDAERAAIGTKYKNASPEKALLLGLELVGPKLSQFVQKAKKFSKSNSVVLYCWRGGKRSSSMAWLLELAGFEVRLLEGGYKKYRQFLLNEFDLSPYEFVVLGGKTGSGKTHILHELAQLGEQVIDLEKIANHKGSAFGELENLPQPTTEQFENQLLTELFFLNPTKKIWIENESRTIGKNSIPQHFWDKKIASTLIDLEIPFDTRVNNIIADYQENSSEMLINSFQKIHKKIGGLQFKNAIHAVENCDLAAAAGVALQYYDKTYSHCLAVNVSQNIYTLKFENENFHQIAMSLLTNINK